MNDGKEVRVVYFINHNTFTFDFRNRALMLYGIRMGNAKNVNVGGIHLRGRGEGVVHLVERLVFYSVSRQLVTMAGLPSTMTELFGRSVDRNIFP